MAVHITVEVKLDFQGRWHARAVSGECLGTFRSEGFSEHGPQFAIADLKRKLTEHFESLTDGGQLHYYDSIEVDGPGTRRPVPR